MWRRAAQLQAEAAARLESRVRDTGLGADTRALPAAGNNEARTTTESAAQTDGFRAHDVEAAALEAGISQRYVALAMAELQSSSAAMQQVNKVPAWQDRVATRLLGTAQRSLSVARPFRFPPRMVLAALGRTLQAHPYGLELIETVGGHPLDGGVLVFRIPDMVGSDYRFTWTRYGVYVRELRVTISSLPGDPRGCEVTANLDLRRGLGANIAGYGLGISGSVATGAGIAAATGVKVMALAGAALAAPVLGAGMVFGIGAYAAPGALYRWQIAKTTAEVERALAAVDASIRAMDIFGEAPPVSRSMPAPQMMPLGNGSFVPME